MLSYCLRCRNNTENKNPKAARTKNGRIILKVKMWIKSKCAMCDTKEYKVTKDQENSGLLRSLGVKTPLS